MFGVTVVFILNPLAVQLQVASPTVRVITPPVSTGHLQVFESRRKFARHPEQVLRFATQEWQPTPAVHATQVFGSP